MKELVVYIQYTMTLQDTIHNIHTICKFAGQKFYKFELGVTHCVLVAWT